MKNYLPAGSIVKLKAAPKRLMIAGIIQMEEGKEENLHDYLGVPYPEGFMGPGMNFLFDEGDIEEVVFRGFEDEEREEFLAVIEAIELAMAQREQSSETPELF